MTTIAEAVQDVSAFERQFRSVLAIGKYLKETADIEQARREAEDALSHVQGVILTAKDKLGALLVEQDNAEVAIQTATAQAALLNQNAERSAHLKGEDADQYATKTRASADEYARVTQEATDAAVMAHNDRMAAFAKEEEHKLGQIAELENALEQLRKRLGIA